VLEAREFTLLATRVRRTSVSPLARRSSDYLARLCGGATAVRGWKIFAWNEPILIVV
jgi:hypothetical protein